MNAAHLISSFCLTSLLLTGCSSSLTQPTEYSGFLKDYSKLKEAKSPSGAPVLRWIDPQLDTKAYRSVYIEPSQLYPKPQPTAQIPQGTLQGITAYYDQALKRELGKSLPLASAPGPGVIVVRPAITGVSSKTEGLKPYEVIRAGDVQRMTAGTGVRKGTGKPLENTSQVLKPDDVKGVIDGWASDLHQSYLKLKAK